MPTDHKEGADYTPTAAEIAAAFGDKEKTACLADRLRAKARAAQVAADRAATLSHFADLTTEVHKGVPLRVLREDDYHFDVSDLGRPEATKRRVLGYRRDGGHWDAVYYRRDGLSRYRTASYKSLCQALTAAKRVAAGGDPPKETT